MHLIEENIESKMFELFNSKPNWIDVYKELKIICENEDSDIGECLNARFVYNMIKNKVDLEQFSQVMSYLYENSSNGELGNQLNDFFYRRDTHICLADYMKLD